MRKLILIIGLLFYSLIGYNQCSTVVASYTNTSALSNFSFIGPSYLGAGQSFIPASNFHLCSCEFYINKLSFSGNAYAELYADAGSGNCGSDTPAGIPIATSDAVTSLSTGWNTFTFSGANQYTLSTGTKYWIIFDVSQASAFIVFYYCQSCATSNCFTFWSGGVAWGPQIAGYTCGFQVYGQPAPSTGARLLISY